MPSIPREREPKPVYSINDNALTPCVGHVQAFSHRTCLFFLGKWCNKLGCSFLRVVCLWETTAKAYHISDS